jgi:hypothetical protein
MQPNIMVMKLHPTPFAGNFFASMAWLLAMTSVAQVTGDYRSATSGNWTAASTWERFDGNSFVAAPTAPVETDGVITIRTGHTVNVNNPTTADQVVVEAGATLSIPSILNLSDGAGPDLVVNGTLQLNAGTFQGSGLAQVNGGGNFRQRRGPGPACGQHRHHEWHSRQGE